MGAWIETCLCLALLSLSSSHPTWVRGLKLDVSPILAGWGVSHPTWVRGLKLEAVKDNINEYIVAPYVGAWIETSTLTPNVEALAGRTLRGCVD